MMYRRRVLSSWPTFSGLQRRFTVHLKSSATETKASARRFPFSRGRKGLARGLFLNKKLATSVSKRSVSFIGLAPAPTHANAPPRPQTRRSVPPRASRQTTHGPPAEGQILGVEPIRPKRTIARSPQSLEQRVPRALRSRPGAKSIH